MHDSALIIFTAIAIVLCLLPARMQWRARNTGTLLNILWNLIGNSIYFLNAIIWWNRYDDRAPVFCDFSVKLQVALASGLTASSLCINRRLASIAMSRAVSSTPNQKRVDLAIDLSLGIGLPVVLMALSYIVQPHRYDIFEGFGCEGVIYASVPAIFIINLVPIVLGVASAIYGGIAVAFFLSRRLQFSALLKSSQSGLDTSQYIRLISLASLDLFISLPLNIYFLAVAVPVTAARTWPGFEDVHYNWHRVDRFAASEHEQNPASIIMRSLTRWMCPTFAIIFFIFFGVSRDAIGEYVRNYRWITKKLGRHDVPHTEQPPFIPKLGSAVAEPFGARWSDKRREKEDAELGDSGYVKTQLGTSAMSVAVKVETDITR